MARVFKIRSYTELSPRHLDLSTPARHLRTAIEILASWETAWMLRLDLTTGELLSCDELLARAQLLLAVLHELLGRRPSAAFFFEKKNDRVHLHGLLVLPTKIGDVRAERERDALLAGDLERLERIWWGIANPGRPFVDGDQQSLTVHSGPRRAPLRLRRQGSGGARRSDPRAGVGRADLVPARAATAQAGATTPGA